MKPVIGDGRIPVDPLIPDRVGCVVSKVDVVVSEEPMVTHRCGDDVGSGCG